MNTAGPAAVATARSLDDELVELEWLRSTDVAARLATARELERRSLAVGDDHAVMRARLVLADMLPRMGDVAGGARLAVEVRAWATEHGARRLLARCHLVLSSVFEHIGDAASTLEHAVHAIDLLDEGFPAREHGNLLLRLADALEVNGSSDQARRRYHEAEEIYRSIGDRERVLIVLNNLAVLESEIGDAAAANAAAERLERAIGTGESNSDFAETIARARLVGGDLAGARRAAEAALQHLVEDGDTKASSGAELALTYAEVLLASGRVHDAQAELDLCIAMCETRHLAGVLAQAVGVQAEVFAVNGHFEQAYRAHREFHAATMRLRSQQQEAAARTREALFETAEARRAAEAFRLQARLDPLTELYNRRYVDETLSDWLAEPADPFGDGRTGVTVAIVDIDRFKQINDEQTHAIGDEVLRQLARMLAAAHRGGTGGFAARIGGEEFLVVDRWGDPAATVARIEALRAAVQAFDWSTLAPGLHVTISAGVTAAVADDTQRTVLSRADRHLYAAKSGGRNRVIDDTASA